MDAVSHHFSASKVVQEEEIDAGRAFFRDELEWRLARLRSLLRLESAGADTATAVPAAVTPSDEKGMSELIERLMPRLCSAMVKTLHEGGAAVTSSTDLHHHQTDFLPAE